MTINILLVLMGGSLGSIIRYTLTKFVKHITSIKFPIATLIINISGSWLLGVLVSSQLNSPYHLLIGTGFLGGFTTFSTFQAENVTLYKAKEYFKLMIYSLLSLLLCITFAFIGLKSSIL